MDKYAWDGVMYEITHQKEKPIEIASETKHNLKSVVLLGEKNIWHTTSTKSMILERENNIIYCDHGSV